MEVVLVGALIAEFTPEMTEHSPPFPRTRDADFAFLAQDWSSFHRLKKEIVDKLGYTPDLRIEHRLEKGNVQVDLIPYGPRIAPDGLLIWPNSKMEFNVIGFEESCGAAQETRKAGLYPISILSIPGFVLLKIIAFLDRSQRGDPKHKNDAGGVYYWLKNYAEDERRYSLPETWGIDSRRYLTAGSILLGNEVGQLASLKTAILLDRFFSLTGKPNNPFEDAVAFDWRGDAENGIRRELPQLLNAFKTGYALARKKISPIERSV